MSVIRAEHLFKSYNLAPQFEVKHLFQWFGRQLRDRDQHRAPHSFVLKDVSFDLQQGESLGLIGGNGAGKTTLCRLLGGLSLPTRGRLRVMGRVSSLISLGAGFHQELTGLENLHLNCALLGLSKRATNDRIEQIVEFAELSEHIEVPIKRYSSGMLARLGFSVAVHLDPEIILVDEVLAVGDYRFQVKSVSALREFMERGTVVFVSHDLGALERICKRAIWLDNGIVKADGESVSVVQQYVSAQQHGMTEPGEATVPDAGMQVPISAESGPSLTVSRQIFDESVLIDAVETCDENGQSKTAFEVNDTLMVRCRLTILRPTKDIRVVIGIMDIETTAVVTAGDNQLVEAPEVMTGLTVIECCFPNTKLRPRNYGIYVGVSNPKALMPLFIWRDIDTRFFVTGDRRNPNLHYYAPQADLMYSPGVHMSYLHVNQPCEQHRDLVKT